MNLKLASLAIRPRKFFTATAPAAEVSAPPETLRVLYYNIRHGRGMNGKVDPYRIARVIADTRPDHVALQEVDKGVRRSGNIDIAAILGGQTQAAP